MLGRSPRLKVRLSVILVFSVPDGCFSGRSPEDPTQGRASSDSGTRSQKQPQVKAVNGEVSTAISKWRFFDHVRKSRERAGPMQRLNDFPGKTTRRSLPGLLPGRGFLPSTERLPLKSVCIRGSHLAAGQVVLRWIWYLLWFRRLKRLI